VSRALPLLLTLALAAPLAGQEQPTSQPAQLAPEPPARDPFRTPDAVRRAASGLEPTTPEGSERSGVPVLKATLVLAERPAGALLEIDGQVVIVRAGDLVRVHGLNAEVVEIGAHGVRLRLAYEQGPRELVIR
jgi:hypothetical protein